MKKFTKFAAMFLAAGALCVSCTDEQMTYTPTWTGEVSESVESYVVATQVGTAYYYVTADDLKSGSVSVENNGYEGAKLTEYVVVDNKYMYTVADGGGSNPAAIYPYYLNASTGRIACDMTKYYSTVKYEAWGASDSRFIHLAPTTYSTGEVRSVSSVKWADLFESTQADEDVLYNSGNSSVKDAYKTTEGTVNVSSLAGEYEPYYIGYSFSDTRQAQYVAADNYLGTGETVTFSGFAESGEYVYVAVVPMYTIPWAVEKYRTQLQATLESVVGAGAKLDDYIAYGYGSQVEQTTANDGLTTWSNAYTPSGGIPFPIEVDKCYVAVYHKGTSTFDVSNRIALISTDDMGASLCRRVRNPRPSITTDDNGDVYVFSSGGLRKTDSPFYQYFTSTSVTNDGSTTTTYSNRMADLKVVKGEKGGSVKRISAGSTTGFDTSFGTVDIESLIESEYGKPYTFTRVFHIAGSGQKFLLRLMDEDYPISGGATYNGCYNTTHKTVLYDTRFAILDLSSTATLTPVTGLPSYTELSLGSVGFSIHDPFCEDGVAYFPTTLTNGGGTVFYLDTASGNAEAQKGLTTDADYIMGLGKIKGLIYK
ncbi:MAG: DUF4374 domain-containing protein [Rikenellaceae bacterium]